MRVLVLGGGVIGLSSAVRLLERGHEVSVWAKQFPPSTTSNIAAAIWDPYKAYPWEKVKEWGAITLRELVRLARAGTPGVSLCRGKKYFHREVGDPWWRDLVPEFRRLGVTELSEGQVGGYAYATPVADTSVYLAEFLMKRVQALGARLETREAHSLEEALETCPTVVNCTGLGARELAKDDEVFPIRGQVVRVEKTRDEFWMDNDHALGMIYVIPRGSDMILGGIAEDNEWSLETNAATGESILHRCGVAVEGVSRAAVLEHRVGLRPGRSSIRLEAELRSGGKIIHNYGHGGSGITLSWGCADEVVKILGS